MMSRLQLTGMKRYKLSFRRNEIIKTSQWINNGIGKKIIYFDKKPEKSEHPECFNYGKTEGTEVLVKM